MPKIYLQYSNADYISPVPLYYKYYNNNKYF